MRTDRERIEMVERHLEWLTGRVLWIELGLLGCAAVAALLLLDRCFPGIMSHGIP